VLTQAIDTSAVFIFCAADTSFLNSITTQQATIQPTLNLSWWIQPQETGRRGIWVGSNFNRWHASDVCGTDNYVAIFDKSSVLVCFLAMSVPTGAQSLLLSLTHSMLTTTGQNSNNLGGVNSAITIHPEHSELPQ
jgi:hypothetical protein